MPPRQPLSRSEFHSLARTYDLVPVCREIFFDTHTAVTAYARLRDGRFSFLLESVVGGEKWARYTFLGSAPREVVRAAGGRIESWTAQTGWQLAAGEDDPLRYLARRLRETRVAPVPGLPRFFGGAVGYLAYDVVRCIERLPNAPPAEPAMPDALLMFTDTVVAIDNLYGKAIIIALAATGEPAAQPPDRSYDDALARIDAIVARLAEPHALAPLAPAAAPYGADRPLTSSFTQPEFERAVERIRAYILAGDAFQVVLSQRIAVPFADDPLAAYRVLRSLNPSPYLYLLELDGSALVGSSPEALVRVQDRRLELRPIAGTRPRGATEQEDAALAAELLADEKERAEHLMLVDLGRNDAGRVARFGTVRVSGFMQIERYSHVMHIVSQVEAELREDLGAVDVLRACFPAGTVTGAPKVRAMEIIDELEPVGRGAYAGAVGYFGYGDTALDTAIAIRTIVLTAGMAYIQAGAGVVADSEPAREWAETLAKAGALLAVLGAIRVTPLDGA